MRFIRRTISIFAASLFIASPLLAQGAAQERVLAAIAAEKDLSGAAIAVAAMNSEGECLAFVNGDAAMVPASNMKLVSTGLALNELGGDYRFGTSLGYSGSLRDGVLDGDLYIIGGADPTLASPDTLSTPVRQVFGSWKKIIDKAGISCIRGRIIGDGRFVEGPREEQSWLWEDIGTYYGTGMSGLGYFENMLRFNVTAGKNVGDSLKISQISPMSPWLSVKYECSTGEKGTGDQLYLFTTDFATDAVLRGTFGVNKATKTVLCSNKYPELTCALEFSRYLLGAGIHNEGAGYVVGKVAKTWSLGKGFSDFDAASEMTLVGSTDSPSLRLIARKTNYESNNFCAETLFRILGKEKGEDADYPSSREASSKALLGLGLGENSRRNVSIVDGSGLSRKNSLTASFLCRFLAAMMDSPAYEDFYRSIPVLETSKALSSEIAGKVRRKTGSMDGVYCLSGYYEAGENNTIVFSVMINGSPLSGSSTRQAAERILSAIIL